MNKRPRQAITAEAHRLLDQRSGEADWQSWGPYLSERQWGIVREDYSEGGGAWEHLNNADILSMPDKWEYPWYAAWDLAFQCLPLALVDPEFAKAQLVLLTREWYMHPNGQLPAYEWAFGDVNPPVHAWATWEVYCMDRERNGGKGDSAFLERVFHKLMLNFTWWVNRKDADGRNVFQGGFLGLDNIGVFDRSAPLPTGGHINQSDKHQNDPHFRDHLQFYEYFHGDSSRGVGASHQTGWSGLVANLIHELHVTPDRP